MSLDDEQIHGVATHHTRIELRDARMAVTFFKSVPPSLDLIYETASYRSLSSLSDSNMDDLSDTSDTSGMDDGYVDFELWSGVSDHFPHRVTITVGGSRERIEITSDQTPFYERFPIVIPENVQVYEGR